MKNEKKTESIKDLLGEDLKSLPLLYKFLTPKPATITKKSVVDIESSFHQTKKLKITRFYKPISKII